VQSSAHTQPRFAALPDLPDAIAFLNNLRLSTRQTKEIQDIQSLGEPPKKISAFSPSLRPPHVQRSASCGSTTEMAEIESPWRGSLQPSRVAVSPPPHRHSIPSRRRPPATQPAVSKLGIEERSAPDPRRGEGEEKKDSFFCAVTAVAGDAFTDSARPSLPVVDVVAFIATTTSSRLHLWVPCATRSHSPRLLIPCSFLDIAAVRPQWR
jgi:hypothetical protein